MDEEDRRLLRENIEIAKENNLLLSRLVWYQRWFRWLSTIKWLIIIGSALGLLYYFQPMIDGLWRTYGELLGIISETSIQALP